MCSFEPLRLMTPSWCWPRPNSASLAGELKVAATVCVAVPSTVAAVMLLLPSDSSTVSLRSLYVISPDVSLTFTFRRLVVMVTVPEASATQNGVGVVQGLLTDSSVFVGSALAVVYCTRMMSAWQTDTFSFPALNVNVTPVASTANDAPVAFGAAQARAPPPAPAVPVGAPPLPGLPPDAAAPACPPTAPLPAAPPLPPDALPPVWVAPPLPTLPTLPPVAALLPPVLDPPVAEGPPPPVPP